jgi:hypothetical protein
MKSAGWRIQFALLETAVLEEDKSKAVECHWVVAAVGASGVLVEMTFEESGVVLGCFVAVFWAMRGCDTVRDVTDFCNCICGFAERRNLVSR